VGGALGYLISAGKKLLREPDRDEPIALGVVLVAGSRDGRLGVQLDLTSARQNRFLAARLEAAEERACAMNVVAAPNVAGRSRTPHARRQGE